jgi:DNA transposition AAA+ family ATPase
MSKRYDTDPQLREALLEHRTSRGLTNSSLGKMFGVSATFISKYIGDKLDHDPGDFSARATDILRGIAAKLELSSVIFETSVTRAIVGRIEMARKVSDCCVIHGAAGEGKTSAALFYQASCPGTVYIKITRDYGSARDVQSAVFAAIGHAMKGSDYSTSRYRLIVDHLRGRQIAVLVDNAHRLTASGIDILTDLNEDTGCAVVLLGNSEVLHRIKPQPQRHSRFGVAGEAAFPQSSAGSRELADVAKRVVSMFSDDAFADAVSDLAVHVASHPGRLRTLRKTTILAVELQKAKGFPPREAFRHAHRAQVVDYSLPSD